MRGMRDGKEWLSTGEAAELARVSPSVVWRWMQRSDAPKHERTAIGGHLRINRDAFEGWLEERRRERAQEQSA